MLKKILCSLFLVGFIAVSAAVLWGYRWLDTPLSIPQGGVEYTLAEGGSVGRAAYDLSQRNILQFPRLLVLYARFTEATSVKFGQYRIVESTTPRQLLQQLLEGKVIHYELTLVEGWTYQQALQYLHSLPQLQRQLVADDWPQNSEFLGVDVAHPEGWFFPDTYQYTAADSDATVLRRAYTAMTQALDDEWQKKAENLPYKNAYEALIMASIVERETGAAHEREQIAGVFVRRLNRGMRLQTDPTVIYGMGSAYKGNIRRSDLRAKTPYNTYRINGLPPTPIAMPGREAIAAALHPDSSTSVYFVARGDGSHQFSSNLADHNKAVRQYQFKRRSDYRSAPAP